jgi:hypothetical protein
VASGTAAACCTRCRTTLRRRAPVFSSASSHVGWTSELRSPAGPSLGPSFPRLPAQTMPNMRGQRCWPAAREPGRGNPVRPGCIRHNGPAL